MFLFFREGSVCLHLAISFLLLNLESVIITLTIYTILYSLQRIFKSRVITPRNVGKHCPCFKEEQSDPEELDSLS